ncbi:DNA repair protein Rad9,Rhp9 [Dermatophagoides farinae]|uniref:DNA repair protein Rad9,Rhp9 n=2 Tax=Dermatophagoides farinae TaxID=6954 RepID=A0A922I762_DERFA|nr:hypothetical protein HUG17_8172 [Dermatophagoides farinae]KAH9526249.1 DNA repair protein Rad9,Rhp9 [Dermatophagoides farinae]
MPTIRISRRSKCPLVLATVFIILTLVSILDCQSLPYTTISDDQPWSSNSWLHHNDDEQTAPTTTGPIVAVLNMTNEDANISHSSSDSIEESRNETMTIIPPSSLSLIESSTNNPLISRDGHFGIDAELKCQSNDDCPEHSECVDEFCRCRHGHCQNLGQCLVVSDAEVYCFCTGNFSGPRCEYRNQACGMNHNCQNGATCSLIENSTMPSCICKPGYHGENCEHILHTCDTINCLNNGHCQINGPDGLAVCQCIDGFDGKNCEHNIDDCPKPNPCSNGGHCVDGISNYTCQCIPPYYGANCTNIWNPCQSPEENPCQNGGHCLTAQDFLSYNCSCSLGFTGDNCEINIDDCAQHNCSNGQICIDLVNGYRCECSPGFEGIGCKNRIDHCKKHKCQNGTCLNNLTDYSCYCATGYEGQFCEHDIDECSVHHPCVHGLCVNQPGSFECYCRPGYTGPLCQLDIDECLSGPCQNNGTCKNLQSTYECDCPPEYSGKNCELEVDECKSNPCENGGTCTDLIGGYLCHCPSGIQGSQCQLDIDECIQNPCQNGGSCVNELASYHCECHHGFEGIHCEKDVDECVISPCMNNGTCLNRNGTYECECLPGFEGDHCEKDVDECAESVNNDNDPCLNGGRCIDLVNAFECNCTETGFDGPHCEKEINDCEPMPCSQLGTLRCEDLHLNYSCHCRPGFTGHHCEIDIDECESNPCQNGGTCQQKAHDASLFGQNFRDKYELDELTVLRHSHQAVGYTCTCVPGFEGIDCEINKDDCQINHCQNGGICIDEINSYSCQCIYGFEGKMCQYLIDPCISSPCRNGATCLKKSNDSYICECTIGWLGERCDRRRSCYMPECHPEHSHCVKKMSHIQHNLCACLPNPAGLYNRSLCDPIYDCSMATGLCQNGGTCVQSGRGYYCICSDDYEGLICEKKKRINLVVILIASVGAIMTIALAVIMLVVFRSIKRARATRGTYSPSTQEMFGNSAGEILKPPPEERLI